LNTDLLDTHDVVQLQRSLLLCNERSTLPNWDDLAEQAVMAYKAPFLNDCYLEWAVTVRQTLEIQVFDLARRLLQRLADRKQWDQVVPIANHLMARR
jgi:hypothetical protein